MWTRAELKTRAKAVLSKSYWKALLVSIVIAFAGGHSGGGGGGSFNYRFSGNDFERFADSPGGGSLPFFLVAFAGIAFFIFIIAVSLRIFLGYPLEVGGRRYFIQSAKDDADTNNLGYAFKKERYMEIIKAMLYRSVLTFLWTLLLIIPGIVKGYAYRMVPYILSENPRIGYKRAIELSNKMTDGEKMDMFVLDLSFIGWYLLGLLALFIGTIFVMPYENATKAELYLVLRQKALDTGICSYEELNSSDQYLE